VHNEFTAIIEQDGEWFIAYALEVQGANGQGRTKDEALQSLREAIALILEDRREDGLRGVPGDASRDTIVEQTGRGRADSGYAAQTTRFRPGLAPT
jgi:predicted RNase H-like HicB family nuclease